MGIVCFLGDYLMYNSKLASLHFRCYRTGGQKRSHQSRTSKDAAFDGASFPIITMCFCAVLAGHIIEHKKQLPDDLIIPSLDQTHPPKYVSAVYLCSHYTPDLLVTATLNTTPGSLDAMVRMSDHLVYPPARGTAQRKLDGLSIPSSHLRLSATNVISTIVSYHHASRPGTACGAVGVVTRWGKQTRPLTRMLTSPAESQ